MPPFNMDMVDAEKVKDDRRLPFGLPGVNKGKRVSNGNYLWISYFHSYLGPKGRAGFVMSSQASSAGHGEADVRRKIVETGDVDVMISIRSNFFYTRTVPCELWFFDKGKPKERRDQVLMLDARHVFRKVTRKIYDFSPEHLADLTAIVWLHRGETKRFAALLDDYREKCRAHREALLAALPEARETLERFGTAIEGCGTALSAEFLAAKAALDLECAALEMGSTGGPPVVSGGSPETRNVASRSHRDKSRKERPSTSDAIGGPPTTAGGPPALPDADASRALLHRLREVRRVAESLTAAALASSASARTRRGRAPPWKRRR